VDQVHPREINLFYISAGSRNRIVRQDDTWRVLETDLQFTKETLLGELNLHPDRFSPNVVLRPVYQEVLLPNLAYVGGPAEIAYWLEFKLLFETLGISYPGLVLRNSFLLINVSTASRMEKQGLNDQDIFRSFDEWVRNQLSVNSADPFKSAFSELESVYHPILEVMKSTDPTLASSVNAELQKSRKGLELLQEKWFRAEKRKQETVLNQLRKIHDKIHPEGQFQERSESLIGWLALFGPTFIDSMLDACSPLNKHFTILRENTSEASK
jgi:bacillithiol biosynthesis cysteine-adding enzyme BshC